MIDYGAAKPALVNLAKSLSQEFGPQGVPITSVSPGPIETDLWLGKDGVANTVGRASGVRAGAVREQTESGIATGRFSTPREIATLVVLLASPRTANVTGANWVIDGGMLKTTRARADSPGNVIPMCQARSLAPASRRYRRQACSVSSGAPPNPSSLPSGSR